MNKPVLTFNDLPEKVESIYLELQTVKSLLQDLATLQGSKQQSDRPLTIQEASEFLHLSIHTLYQRVASNTIPFSKKGSRLYFSEKDLTAWVTSGRRKSTEEIVVKRDAFLSKGKKKA